MTALEIQYNFLAVAKKFLQDHEPHNNFLDNILDLWERTLAAIDTQNFSTIDTEIDWAIKHKFLNAYASKNTLDWNSLRLVQLDMSYHDIHPQRGLYNLLKNRGAAARFLTEAQIDEARHKPPQTTRAFVRHHFIEQARNRGLDYSLDWTQMKINDHPMLPIHMRDAFETDLSTVNELFAKITSDSH